MTQENGASIDPEVKQSPIVNLVRELAYMAIGRASLCFDWAYRLSSDGRAEQAHRFGQSHHDKSGLVLHGPRRAPFVWRDAEVVVADFGSIAHSLWRAQELSLFAQHKDLIEGPTLDLGCGDGSFAAVLFDRIDFGVDNDPEALMQARQCGVYGQLIQSTDTAIPLPDGSIRTVISNSVLEHVAQLNTMITEINRVLLVGGHAIVTVPTINYHRHLATYFGETEAATIGRLSYHRNLLSTEEWIRQLAGSGFALATLREYQPNRFTFWYRMFRLFGHRGLGRFFPNIGSTVWNRLQSVFVEMVRHSIRYTVEGANVLLVAQKVRSVKAC